MVTIGILAHVDAGKTTLSEAILYETGSIRTWGRVDNGDTAMDTHELERARGITIFSNRAVFTAEGKHFTLLDTPGHADFSAETERTLSVLDYAILVISAPEGVQSHTVTLRNLLRRYHIPVFVFVNKMDRYEGSREDLLTLLREKLGDDLAAIDEEEEIAMCEEALMERYLTEGRLPKEEVRRVIAEGKFLPVCFGSALKREGVAEFLKMLAGYVKEPEYSEEFQARVYKISHDGKHNRITHMKILGGRLAVRDKVGDEKVSGIAEGTEINAGEFCSVTGLSLTRPGQGIGCEDAPVPVMEPVMTYRVLLPEGISEIAAMEQLREIQEENPELEFVREEQTREITVRVMGAIQLEVLQAVVKDRFDMDISFGAGSIVYKETIADTVEGVGHFEPLRHYAEVHLLMEPGEPGSGIVAAADVSTDVLALNWQRLIVTHLLERRHAGVLTGSELTDVKITVKGGRAHLKHTEGGDFRQATYRAVRQGLMEATSILLEPYYDFVLELPTVNLGRAMTDLETLFAKCSPPEQEGDRSVLRGFGPVSCLWNYQAEVAAYTGGYGSISLTLRGYGPCHDPEDVIARRGYDPDSDLRNPSASVFCSHGSGTLIPWDQVKQYMHTESILAVKRDEQGVPLAAVRTANVDLWLDSEEVDAIIKRTGMANARPQASRKEKVVHDFGTSATRKKPQPVKPKYLLIDGYNIIFAWPELKAMAQENIDSARLMLQDLISNYAGFRGIDTAVVFDAYRVENHKTELLDYHNIHVVFTATAETADHYIERFTHENASRYDITVATSDGVEQIIIRSQGCCLMSATNLREEVSSVQKEIKDILHGSV